MMKIVANACMYKEQYVSACLVGLGLGGVEGSCGIIIIITGMIWWFFFVVEVKECVFVCVGVCVGVCVHACVCACSQECTIYR